MTTDQSPIHRGLANYDVLCTVFDTIRLRKADLRNAALVCRTFKEPALRKLWRTLATSIPLWHLLAPENIAYPNRITEAYLDLIISAKLHKDPQRWNSFRWYAQRIRYLQLRFSMHLRSKYELLIHTVLAHLGEKTLFPALRGIWNSNPSTGITPLFDRMFTAQLRKASFVHIHPFDGELPPFMAVVKILRTRSTHLRKIRIVGYHSPPDLSHLVHELSAFRYLRYIDLTGSVSASAFHTLVTTPNLEELRVEDVIVPDGIDVSPPPSHPILASSQLRRLFLHGSCAAIMEAMSAIRTEQLAGIFLEVNNPNLHPQLSDYTSCFEAVAQALLTPQTLKWFFVCLSAESEEWEALLLSDVFYPMFEPLRQTSFQFFLNVSTTMFASDDEDFLEMALGWPKLTMFDVSMIQWDEDERLPTPAVLHHFWENCPDLKFLALPYLDLTAESTEVPKLPTEVSSHGLRQLQVSSIPAIFEAQLDEDTVVYPDDIETWAHYIACLFPNVRLEESYEAIPGRLSWGSVFDHLRSSGGLSAPSGAADFSEDRCDMSYDGFNSDEDW